MTWDPGNRNLSQDRQLDRALERSHQYWSWSIRVDGSRRINQEQKDKTNKLSEGLTILKAEWRHFTELLENVENLRYRLKES